MVRLVFRVDKLDGEAIASPTDCHVLCICESAKMSYEGDDLARPGDPEVTPRRIEFGTGGCEVRDERPKRTPSES